MDGTHNRRGRPRLVPGEDTIPLTVSLPASSYDRLARLAMMNRTDLAKLARELLARGEREYSNEKLAQRAA